MYIAFLVRLTVIFVLRPMDIPDFLLEWQAILLRVWALNLGVNERFNVSFSVFPCKCLCNTLNLTGMIHFVIRNQQV